MQVRFLKDFRSAATGENFFEAGDVADLPRGAEVVAEGAAEVVTIDSRRGQVDPTATKIADPDKGKQTTSGSARVSSESLPFDDTPKGKRKAT